VSILGEPEHMHVSCFVLAIPSVKYICRASAYPNESGYIYMDLVEELVRAIQLVGWGDSYSEIKGPHSPLYREIVQGKLLGNQRLSSQ
jgi:hypothetical protein